MNNSINLAITIHENIARLPPKINRRGATYILIKRGAKAMIYARTVPNENPTYEVFIIKIRKESIIKGKLIPAGEIFPHDEAFGKWACGTLAH